MAGPDDKIRMMEAEMNRFEAEIGVPVPAYHAQAGRPVIGANTYHQVQQQLEQRQASRPSGMPFLPMLPTASNPAAIASLGGIPPPPPPPPLLIPHQVQRTPMVMRPHMKDSHHFSHHERPPPPPPGPQAVPAIVSATPKLYVPNKSPATNKHQAAAHDPPRQSASASKKARKVETPAARAKEAEKVIIPPANVGPSFSLEELGPKRTKERRNANQDRPDHDFRIFCGDLGNDVTDEVLTRAFNRFPSFQKAKVVRDKRTNKTKGFGFVSFKDPQDFINAMKEMNETTKN
ncbi:hypothetical protein B566_EDAN016597 [Ephemera danica]|nr:hypothetical protein B566_EDAN016597 [Ephemera danica]